MTTWNDVLTEAPELAALSQSRMEATGLGFLATIRKDGGPRISGVEPSFFDGELWLGMMDGSLKARDLQRDPRFSLHNASADKEVKDGDTKISGNAIEVTDEAVKLHFLERFSEMNGYGPEPGPMHLFTADVTEVVTIKPSGDHLDIDTWKAGRGLTHVDRY